jgi:S-adenosylmethionine:tRNA ribosyltransferase-isomerase
VKAGEFDFELPEHLIAQEPAARRDGSRLLVLERETGRIAHRRFTDLPDELRPGDLIVVNDTKVFPARLQGVKPTGGRIEMLLVERVGGGDDSLWRVMLGGSKSVRPGVRLAFAGGLSAVPLEREDDFWRVRLEHDGDDLDALLDRIGEVPLPPYIHRVEADARAELDRDRYQTVFARAAGAVAAPTAGLHLTSALLAALVARGIETAAITLHVGPGTFLPLRVDDVEAHRMHEEAYVLPEDTAEAIRRARERRGRVVAVGTTVARTLETCADGSGGVTPGGGRSALFIYPGFHFRVVDGLVTNFHLPKSTLLMLVCALAGRGAVLTAYAEAVREGYRFYSFGDAMLVRPA